MKSFLLVLCIIVFACSSSGCSIFNSDPYDIKKYNVTNEDWLENGNNKIAVDQVIKMKSAYLEKKVSVEADNFLLDSSSHIAKVVKIEGVIDPMLGENEKTNFGTNARYFILRHKVKNKSSFFMVYVYGDTEDLALGDKVQVCGIYTGKMDYIKLAAASNQPALLSMVYLHRLKGDPMDYSYVVLTNKVTKI